ncbi:hypothetical protein HYPSUDRAFT_47862, partial [Hypholoma sublateritium FD-334 SS-4]
MLPSISFSGRCRLSCHTRAQNGAERVSERKSEETAIFAEMMLEIWLFGISFSYSGLSFCVTRVLYAQAKRPMFDLISTRITCHASLKCTIAIKLRQLSQITQNPDGTLTNSFKGRVSMSFYQRTLIVSSSLA